MKIRSFYKPSLLVSAVCVTALPPFTFAASPTPPPPPSAAAAPAPTKTSATPAATAVTPVQQADAEPVNAKAVRLEEIEVTTPAVTALTQAPTDSTLDALQPQSIINLNYIANSIAPTADYSTIANLAPSVANVVTNGPGLSDARRATVRGFDDSQYNVTYDGIPFADTNDFTHHTTSYFPAKMIGRVIVDRGPGTASTIGEATFGGTIALFSKDPRTDMAVIPTLSFGSYDTFLGHIEANTGLLHSLNDASAIASYQYMRTNGYQTNVKMRRDTTYVKYLQPIGKNTTLTFLSNYNSITFNNPVPITQAQIDTRGRNFGLSNDPTDPLYWGYNRRKNKTDFEYIGIDTTLANTWHVSDKVYTFYYSNASYDTTKIGTNASPTDIGGRFKISRYRAWGDYLVVSHDDLFGTLKLGAWMEYQRNLRTQYNLDYTLGGILDVKPAGTGSVDSAYQYDLVNYLKTLQPFIEYEWRVNKKLVINGGVKFADFKRKISARINQTTKTPLMFEKKNTETMPSVSANYSIENNWSVYAEVARGFLAPNLNLFYVPHPENNQIKPQETTNYQVGTVFKHDRFDASLDAYYIDYKNFPLSVSVAGSDPYFAMASGAKFSGVEFESTYLLGNGLSFYDNASINNAKFKRSKVNVPAVARGTAAVGLIYNHSSGFFGSVVDKYVGRSKIYAPGFNPDDATTFVAPTASTDYWIADLSVGYAVKLNGHFLRSVKVRLQVDNLFDKKAQVVDSVTAKGVASFNVLPERNYFLSISGEF